ncbi:MAG: phosphoheptose isomerase, partial [Deltaproteobacteria bacterium]
LPILAGGGSTARVQEAHILAGHIICRLVDHILFQSHLSGE